MNNDKKILDKRYLIREIILDHFLMYVFAIILMLGLCFVSYVSARQKTGNITDNHYFQFFVVCSVFGTAYMIFDFIIRIKHLTRINNDDFFVMKSLIIRKDKSDDYYYFIFHNEKNCSEGNIVHNVSRVIFDSFDVGDCFYLVFFGNDNIKTDKVRYMFQCDCFELDSDLMTNYADCSKWHIFENDELGNEETNSYSNLETENLETYNNVDELPKKVFDENLNEENTTGLSALKILGVIVKKIAGVLIGLVCAVGIFMDPKEVYTETPTVFVVFALSLLVSVFMVFTKVKLLFVLYVTAFFVGASVEPFFLEKDYSLGVIFLVIAILTAIPVLIANKKRKKNE